MIRRLAGTLVLLAGLCQVAIAELTIEITRGSDQPVPVAIVPFGWQGGALPPEDIAKIVESDLHRSGQFAPMPRTDMLSMPRKPNEVFFRDWRSLGVSYVVVGEVRKDAEGRLQVGYHLMDVHQEKAALSGTESAPVGNVRDIAHAISDRIYEKLTNIKGAFSTKLLYVSALREPSGRTRYRLLVSDIDGARERVLRDQYEPILTPSWSPNGKIIAYVSFETTRPGIYLHNIETGERKHLTNFPGINGAPVWSPDGRKLAMVLSKDGNPEIYVMDLASQNLQRITRHFAIDTEPDWMEDGRSLIFTSDRGGKPQIYKVALATGDVERVTYTGDYNARGRVLPGGNAIIMVHRREGSFHIAVQDLKRGSVHILTQTALDESPSVAPNGTILLYATRYQGKGILAAVSVDGSVQYRLPSQFGEVREPAWSPYLQ